MPRTRVNGVELYREVQGAGEPLVMVHGSWGDQDNWAPVVPELARDFRVVTYDRRGHSRSERPAGQGSVHEDAADLAALVEQLGLAPAHIVGNSAGSAVALRPRGARGDALGPARQSARRAELPPQSARAPRTWLPPIPRARQAAGVEQDHPWFTRPARTSRRSPAGSAGATSLPGASGRRS